MGMNEIPYDKSDLSKSNIQENIETNQPTNYGQSAIDTINGVAYLALYGGILGAVVIWITMGYVKAGYSSYEPNPDGIILGFVVFFSSIITSSLLFVLTGIGENLIAIRKNTEK